MVNPSNVSATRLEVVFVTDGDEPRPSGKTVAVCARS